MRREDRMYCLYRYLSSTDFEPETLFGSLMIWCKFVLPQLRLRIADCGRVRCMSNDCGLKYLKMPANDLATGRIRKSSRYTFILTPLMSRYLLGTGTWSGLIPDIYFSLATNSPRIFLASAVSSNIRETMKLNDVRQQSLSEFVRCPMVDQATTAADACP